MRVYVANISLKFVNSINYIVIYDVEAYGEGWLYWWPMTHIMFGLSMALQYYFWVPHVHRSSRVVTIFP